MSRHHCARTILRAAGTALLLLLTAQLGRARALEFVSAEFFSRPGEIRAVFHLSGPGALVRDSVPMPGKVLVEVENLCRTSDFGNPTVQVCEKGPVATLQPLYRFETSLPVQQLNVVDMGTGTVQLIWKLRGTSLPHSAAIKGDSLEVVIGSPADAEPAPSGTAAPPVAGASRAAGGEPTPGHPVPSGHSPAVPAVEIPTPTRKADTVFGEPDPAYLQQNREYRLGAGDRLRLVVHADDRLSRESLEIAPTGYVDLPLIGSLPVAGRTVSEVEKEVERLYGEKYLRDPDVTVLVDEYNSQFVNILGAVGQPGRVPLRGRTTLMDILSEVGGTTEDAGGSIVIHRRGETEPTRILLSDLLSGRQGANVLLQDGDTINVETKMPFYVSGEVDSPGKYDVEAGMTVLDALAVAGGITPYGKRDRVVLLRTVNGERKEMILNPKAIEKGKDPNIEILPGDHLKVPKKYL